jgi:hypothetical protein
VAALAAAMAVIVALDMTRVAGFEEDEPARAELVVFLRRQYIFSTHRLQEWVSPRNGLAPGAPAALVPETSASFRHFPLRCNADSQWDQTG